jgi:hypothetical protein
MKKELEIPPAVGFCKKCFRGRRNGSAYCGECQNELPRKAIYISNDRFPLLDKVTEKFGTTESQYDNVIFTYGDTIYLKNENMPPNLIAHEITHCFQQMVMGKDIWWDKYLKDTKFMLSQEAEAYRNQYNCEKMADETRAEILAVKIANDLSGELYGWAIPFQEALKLIKS